MKVRIFALAKELDMDSKVLIKHCNDAGLVVKSSALASISPDERDLVLNYLKSIDSSGDTTDTSPLTPSRDAPANVPGKVRAIKTTVPRTPISRLRRPKPEETAESAAVAVHATEDGDVTAVDIVAGESGDTLVDDMVVDADVDAVVAESARVGEQDESADESSAISREDYVSASGAARTSLREMKPRGTTSDAARSSARAKAKAKQALPNVAAPPSYKLPKVKKSDEPKEPAAQKPDMRLTPEVLEQQSPLAAHLKKHSEQRKKSPVDRISLRDKMREGEGGLGLVEARQQRRARRKARQGSEEEGDQVRSTRVQRLRRKKRTGPIDLKTSAAVAAPLTIRALSEELGRPAKQLMQVLFSSGQMVTINEVIDSDTVVEIGMELGIDITIKSKQDIEEELLASLQADESSELLIDRPPIVTILGHVDHGKTSLLDKLRSANVADGEAGGITQHIASYQIEHNGKELTFVDTPGHAAFAEMRARGANVTDVIVLVVAADDGVMPQTVECISHAKAAEAPIVVALNKIDLPDTNQEKVLADLASHEITASEWGGDVDVVRTSATTGEGLEDLVETILLTAELHEFKANPQRPALGVCLEAFRDEGRGALAWLIVQKGTLRVGDVVLCGDAFGRIRAMYNDRDEELQEAPPSLPVKVAGLGSIPGAGDHFFVMADIEQARQAAEDRRHRTRAAGLGQTGGPRSLDDILGAARTGAVQDLPLILKADTPGSIEALKGELEKFEHPEVRVKVLHEGVGGVNESDIYLASASGAIIVAFHVIAEDKALALAEKERVDIRRYSIIYEVTAEIKRILEGLLEPEKKEITTGRALVLQTFDISRYGRIAGCRVLSGTIERSNRMHVIRDQKIIKDYNIASLKREKDDAKEVREGMECGIRLDGFNDVKEGDLLEAFRIETVKRTLD